MLTPQQQRESIAAIITAMIVGMELFLAGAAGVGSMLFSPQDGF
jgi:hypothetical protein